MSETMAARATPVAAGARRIVLVCAPKGGVGKTSIARTLLVSAVQSGLTALGLDFDGQATLHKWHLRREVIRRSFPAFVPVEVRKADLLHWRDALKATGGRDFAVIDTPPSVEDHIAATYELCARADLVVVPTGATQDDVDSVVPWMAALQEHGVRAAFVLNRTNRRTRSFEMYRAKLLKTGPVCPIEIPLLEDVHVPAGKGLTILDMARARGLATFESLWDYVQREARL